MHNAGTGPVRGGGKTKSGERVPYNVPDYDEVMRIPRREQIRVLTKDDADLEYIRVPKELYGQFGQPLFGSGTKANSSGSESGSQSQESDTTN
jgi:hypothetical protein